VIDQPEWSCDEGGKSPSKLVHVISMPFQRLSTQLPSSNAVSPCDEWQILEV
jgi:hypothetical protein